MQQILQQAPFSARHAYAIILSLVGLLFGSIFSNIAVADGSSAPQIEYPLLSNSSDTFMQQALERTLLVNGLNNAVERKELSIALVDITDPENPRAASVNGNHMMYAASLPKIAILLGAFEKAAQGKMDLTPNVRDSLTRMIRVSSNTAATQMYNTVTPKFIAETLQSQKYGFYDRKTGGGLWCGKPYGKSGAWKRDPLKNLSHAASAIQVARFFYFLETNRLASPEYSQQMKEMLGDPAINHKFVAGLANKPGTEIFRKSGTWSSFHADGAIIERDGRRYIAVALANNRAAGGWFKQLIVKMDNIIHDPTRMVVKRADTTIDVNLSMPGTL